MGYSPGFRSEPVSSKSHASPNRNWSILAVHYSQDQESDAREESLELEKHCSSGKCCRLNKMVKRKEEEEEKKEKKEGEEE